MKIRLILALFFSFLSLICVADVDNQESGKPLKFVEELSPHDYTVVNEYYLQHRYQTFQERVDSRLGAIVVNLTPKPNNSYNVWLLGSYEYIFDKFIDITDIHTVDSAYPIYGALSDGCTTGLIDNFFKSNGMNVQLDYDTPCQAYNFTKKKSFFGNVSDIAYRENIDIDQAISKNLTTPNYNAYINSNPIVDESYISVSYNDFLSYANKCLSNECKMDIAILFADPGYFSSNASTFYSNMISADVKANTSSSAIISAVDQVIQKQHNEKWDLSSAMLGLNAVFYCNDKILKNGQSITENVLNSCINVANIAVIFGKGHQLYPMQQERYSEGLHDGVAIVKKYKPNQQQSKEVMNYIQQKLDEFNTMNDTQGFNN